MDKILSMRIFSRVVESGSFSAVAEHMSCSTGSVSRAVSSLEDQLCTRLLQRTTRKISLTEPGERYYQKCKKILADLEEAEAEAGDAHTCARGTLRIHCVTELGLAQLTHSVMEYRKRFPAVAVQLKFLPRMANLFEDEVDVSIVSAPALPDSGNVCKLIGHCERVLIASPGFLQTHRIDAASDVDEHALTPVAFRIPPNEQTVKLSLVKPADQPGSPDSASQFSINDIEAIRIAALAGAGVAALPVHCVSDDIRDGRLVQLFPESRLQNTRVFAVYSSRHHIDAKIKTFIDFMTSHLRAVLDAQLVSAYPQPTFNRVARVMENA
ncbi:LysR family transcriptional regulator [Paraburkholderia sp. C35]|uniref:LysR family transcriptional regulator n=1 Tax=Paraburkholderia sp. C35 TaxID=2126993 RepID=UPI000D68A709|nr:LysR family transcriptional regulator [Paraburkholderia sp. C35]